MSYTQDQIIQIITAEAQQLGVPVDLALAIAKQESGLNPGSIGDGGHSVGLFQLNDRGEGAGMSVTAREDPVANARIALTRVANVIKQNPGLSPGEIAAAAQRPDDRAGYAAAINAALGHPNKGIFGNIAQSVKDVGDTVGGAVVTARADASNQAAQTGNIDGFLQSQAPKLAAELNDPKVKSLLQQWGANQLTDQEFQNQLETTDWWKNTPQSQRQELVSQATDPATVQQKIQDTAQRIDLIAKQMGVGLPGGSEYQLAVGAVSNNWDQTTIQQKVAGYFKSGSPQSQTGQAGVDALQLRNLYAAYALPAGDDASLQRQLQQILSGTTTVDEFGKQLANQAKSLYGNNPDLASALDRGETVQQFMQPYANVASARLGVDPTSIDWTSPKWNAALTGTTDPASGRTTPMSLMQWQRNLITNPVYGWATSQDGISQATQGAQVLAKGLGLGGPQ